ncbi:MAG: hypothetical protein IKN04_11215 [Clostridia bacterium]|nr:hypothetical protein [Clostridia bacterium]
MSQINNANVQEISIKNETFDAFRTDFDLMLKKTLDNMLEKGLEEAEITVKMTVKAAKKEVANPTVSNAAEKRTAIVPTFTHKIVTAYKVESKKEGTLANGRELFYDETTGEYILIEIDDGQTSMFNGTYQAAGDYGDQPINADGSVTDALDELPGPSVLLPAADE